MEISVKSVFIIRIQIYINTGAKIGIIIEISMLMFDYFVIMKKNFVFKAKKAEEQNTPDVCYL